MSTITAAVGAAAKATIEVRPLPRADLDQAAGVLARAFHEDPFIVHLFPDAETRAAALPGVFRGELVRSIGQGGAVGAWDGSRLVGVGVLNPAGDPGVGLADSASRLGSYANAARRNWRHLPRMVGTTIQSDVRAPRGDAFHVNLLGVETGEQGKGIGSALLRHALAEADKAGVPARIETSNPRNVPLYARFGFAEVDRFDAWGGGPTNVTMLRPATPRPLAIPAAAAR